jgi:hypothetical protein
VGRDPRRPGHRRERRPLDDEHGLTGAEGPPIDAGPALTGEDAAHELAADGRSLDEARALVSAYLDDVSAQIGASAHQWGLDAADLAAIRADQTTGPAEPARGAAAQLHEHNAILNREVGEAALRHPDAADGADPWDGYRTYAPAEAAAELVVRGVPPDVALDVVDRYLDGLTRDRGWSPQDQWEIDDDDLAEMAVALESPTPELPAHTRGRTRAGDTEPERRAQLAAWHDDTDPADDGADDLNRSTP